MSLLDPIRIRLEFVDGISSKAVNHSIHILYMTDAKIVWSGPNRALWQFDSNGFLISRQDGKVIEV